MCCKGMSMYLQTCRSNLHQLHAILQLPNLLLVLKWALLRMSACHPASLPSKCIANMELMSLAFGFVAISSMSSAVK